MMLSLQKTPVEFFGLPFDDEILHEARLHEILMACQEVLVGVGHGNVCEKHFDLLSKIPDEDNGKSFYMNLAMLPQKYQQMCFDKIVAMLNEKQVKGVEGFEHIKDHLLEGTCDVLENHDH